MLKLAHKHPWLTAFAVAALLCVVLFLLSLLCPVTHELCTKNEYANKPDCANHHVGPFVLLWILEFLDQHNGLVTALATLAMAAFTGTLWWATVSAGELTKRTVDLAEKQFVMEGKQADLAEKQHALARLQHIAINKPRLEIRSIALAPVHDHGTPLVNGHRVTGSLVVRNSGATDAKILESDYRFFWSNFGLPMRPPLDVGTKTLLDTAEPIAAYGSRLVPIESIDALPAISDFLRNGRSGWSLYVMGSIRYADVLGAERWVGFCRQFLAPDGAGSGSDGRFVPVSNGDYEYSD